MISVGSINQSPIQIHAKRTVALAAGRANSAEYGARVIPAAKLTNMDIANVDTAAKHFVARISSRAKSASRAHCSCEANVFRPPKFEHAVQRGDSNGHLGHLPPFGP